MSSFTGHAEMYRGTYGETPKLIFTNYSTWGTDITAFLRAQDVLEIVRGNEPPPPAGNNQVAIKKTERYRARVGKAFAIIVSSCSLQIKTHINRMEDPMEIWAILKEKLDSVSSRAGKPALVRTFHMLRPLDSETSINQYIARLMDIRTQLAGTNKEMSDARLVSHILTTLPASYESIINTITFAPLEQQTLDNVVNMLSEAEKNRNNLLSASSASSSLTSGSSLAAYAGERSGDRRDRRGRRGNGRHGTRGSSRSRSRHHTHSRSPGRGRGIHKSRVNTRGCWHCGNAGHERSECRKYLPEQRNRPKVDELPDSRAHASVMIVRGTMAIRRQAFISTNTNPKDTNYTKWIVDMGASHHLCRERPDFEKLTPLNQKIEVIIGDGSPMIASAKGSIKLTLPCSQTLTIEALLVPRLHTSLLSVGELTKSEPVTFYNERCFLSGNLIGQRRYGIFDFLGTVKRLRRTPPLPASKYGLAVATSSPSILPTPVASSIHSSAISRSTQPTLQIWHQHLGHLGLASVKALLKKHSQPEEPNTERTQTVDITHILPSTDRGLGKTGQHESPEDEDEETGQCSSCVKTKIRRRIVRAPVLRTKQPFELVHSDLCGPITPLSMGGARYFILYIDDFSRTSHVYFLRSKAAEQVVSVFKEFAQRIETQFPGQPIRRFRCDNGKGEYNNHLFGSILQDSGITFEPSPKYTQHKNAVSERIIATITTKGRAMMIDSNLEDSLWSEVVNTAVYLHAFCPSRTLQGKTPHEVLHGKMGDIGHLRRFGCVAYKLIPKELQRGKFCSRATKCVMVGYTNSTKI